MLRAFLPGPFFLTLLGPCHLNNTSESKAHHPTMAVSSQPLQPGPCGSLPIAFGLISEVALAM